MLKAASSAIALQQALHPGYISGRHYPAFQGATLNTGAVAAADTLYGYPFYLARPVTISALFIRVVTGGTTSSVKLGVWAISPATARPAGTPLASNNTGGATTGSASTVSLAASANLPAGWLFFGSVHTGTLPVCINISGAGHFMTPLVGATSNATAVAVGPPNALSTAQTYANDISALNLTGASWTDVGATPTTVPIVGFTVA